MSAFNKRALIASRPFPIFKTRKNGLTSGRPQDFAFRFIPWIWLNLFQITPAKYLSFFRDRGSCRKEDLDEGWPVTRKEVLTHEGEEMEFFTFEDKSGSFETVFCPNAPNQIPT